MFQSIRVFFLPASGISLNMVLPGETPPLPSPPSSPASQRQIRPRGGFGMMRSLAGGHEITSCFLRGRQNTFGGLFSIGKPNQPTTAIRAAGYPLIQGFVLFFFQLSVFSGPPSIIPETRRPSAHLPFTFPRVPSWLLSPSGCQQDQAPDILSAVC